jgi:hypothetical protein
MTEAADEAWRLCVRRLGHQPRVGFVITYLDSGSLDAFWRSSPRGGVERLFRANALEVSVSPLLHCDEEYRAIVRADLLAGMSPRTFQRATLMMLFRHLLSTQVSLSKTERLVAIAGEENLDLAYLLADAVDCTLADRTSVLGVIFSVWVMADQPDVERLDPDSYSSLVELADELFGGLLDDRDLTELAPA